MLRGDPLIVRTVDAENIVERRMGVSVQGIKMTSAESSQARWKRIASDWCAAQAPGCSNNTVVSLAALLRTTRTASHKEAVEVMESLDVALAHELAKELARRRET